MSSTPRQSISSAAPWFGPELYRRVRQIEIRTRRLVNQTLAGSYLSAFRGQGMEFAETREYRPGDDVRSIDWNVSSRASKPERTLYVKVFTEERELTVMVLADLSGSSRFGTRERSKSELMAELTALLALSAIRNRDRVGLIGFSDRIERYIPPKAGSTHALRIVRELLTPVTEPRGTDLAGALNFLLRVQRKPAVVFLISDLIAPSFERPLRLAAKRHDLAVLELLDPSELEIPDVGPVLLEDAESGVSRLVDTSSRAVRDSLQRTAAARRAQARLAVRRAGAELVSLSTGEPYDRPLLRWFRRRAARIRR